MRADVNELQLSPFSWKRSPLVGRAPSHDSSFSSSNANEKNIGDIPPSDDNSNVSPSSQCRGDDESDENSWSGGGGGSRFDLSGSSSSASRRKHSGALTTPMESLQDDVEEAMMNDPLQAVTTGIPHEISHDLDSAVENEDNTEQVSLLPSSDQHQHQGPSECLIDQIEQYETEIHDVPGFLCVCAVITIGDMSRGVMFPSLWPLVQSLGGSQVFLGYAVAAFSLGRVVVNPLFGAWSHTRGYTQTLLLATSILLFGTLVYAQVPNMNSLVALLAAQMILGVGSGTLGVTRAYVADVTAKRTRTKYMARITAFQYGGFTVTPILGAAFNYMLQDRTYQIGWFVLNMYTAPAYFMFLVVLSVILCLRTFFRDRQRVVRVASTEQEKSRPVAERTNETADERANRRTWMGISVFDCCILGCMLLNISTRGSIASFETLGIAIAQSNFHMISSRAGFIVAMCGACGVVSLLNMGILEENFTDVTIATGGMLVMGIGIASMSGIHDGVHPPSWLYGLSMFFIYAIGYPIGNTAVIGLFSKSKILVQRRAELAYWFLIFVVVVVVVCSYWSPSSRTISRLVRLCWIPSSNDLSGRVWLHCQL